jgi:hypothetical protein
MHDSDSGSEFEDDNDVDADYDVSLDNSDSSGSEYGDVHGNMHGVQGDNTVQPGPAMPIDADNDDGGSENDSDDGLPAGPNIGMAANAPLPGPATARVRGPRGRGRGRGGHDPGRGDVQNVGRNVNELEPMIGDHCPNNWTRLPTPAVGAAPTYMPDLAWCPQFNQQAQFGDGCLKEDMAGKMPVDFFDSFFPPGIYTHVAEQTNVYALQYFDGLELMPKSRLLEWTDTNPDEIRALVGLEIAMGMCDKPRLSDYFETYWLTAIPGFGSVMARNRYQLLRTFLHMNNNTDRIPKG